MIQNLQINALSTKPVLFNSSNVQKTSSIKYKKNLNADLVSFTSLPLLGKTPILKRVINLISGRPTFPEIMKEVLVISSQLSAVASAGVALSILPAKFAKQLSSNKALVGNIKK